MTTSREPLDAGLARERTLLARRRTALSVGLVSAALVHLVLARTAAVPALGVGVAVLAALATLCAAVSSRSRLRPGLDTLTLAIATALLALAAAVATWLTR